MKFNPITFNKITHKMFEITSENIGPYQMSVTVV